MEDPIKLQDHMLLLGTVSLNKWYSSTCKLFCVTQKIVIFAVSFLPSIIVGWVRNILIMKFHYGYHWYKLTYFTFWILCSFEWDPPWLLVTHGYCTNKISGWFGVLLWAEQSLLGMNRTIYSTGIFFIMFIADEIRTWQDRMKKEIFVPFIRWIMMHNAS